MKTPPTKTDISDNKMKLKISTVNDQNEIKKKEIFRIHTTIGHLSGIEKMIQTDAYCLDILRQLSAVQSSLSALGRTVSQKHMSHCILSALEEGKAEEKIEELMATLKYLKYF